MARTMNLKEACRLYGLSYRRAWYALATGRLNAKVVGRTWSLTEAQAVALKEMLTARPPR
jgi:hypothetical protein